MKPLQRLRHAADQIRAIENEEFPDRDLNTLRMELAVDVEELAAEYEDRYGDAATVKLKEQGSNGDDQQVAEAFETDDETEN